MAASVEAYEIAALIARREIGPEAAVQVHRQGFARCAIEPPDAKLMAMKPAIRQPLRDERSGLRQRECGYMLKVDAVCHNVHTSRSTIAGASSTDRTMPARPPACCAIWINARCSGDDRPP